MTSLSERIRLCRRKQLGDERDFSPPRSETTHEPLNINLNQRIILDEADARFIKAIGDQRYKDVELKKPSKTRRVTLLGR